MVEPGKPMMTTQHMRFAYRITKAKNTNTHSEYVIFMFIHVNNGFANVPYC